MLTGIVKAQFLPTVSRNSHKRPWVIRIATLVEQIEAYLTQNRARLLTKNASLPSIVARDDETPCSNFADNLGTDCGYKASNRAY